MESQNGGPAILAPQQERLALQRYLRGVQPTWTLGPSGSPGAGTPSGMAEMMAVCGIISQLTVALSFSGRVWMLPGIFLPPQAAAQSPGTFPHDGKTVEQFSLPRWESCGRPGNKASRQPAEGLGEGVSHPVFLCWEPG